MHGAAIIICEEPCAEAGESVGSGGPEGIHLPGKASKSLSIITWNVGSMKTHKIAIISLLSTSAPHVLFIQESRLSNGAERAWRITARELGYCFYPHVSNDLAAFAIRGLNFAPIRNFGF